MRDALATALLVAGVAIQLLGAAGIVRMRRPLDRLHFVGASVPAALCIGAAVVVEESFSLIGDKALVVAVFVLVTAPVLTHATARVIHAGEGDR